MSKPRKEKQHLDAKTRNELDKRYKDHQNGIGKSFTWEESHNGKGTSKVKTTRLPSCEILKPWQVDSH